MIYLLVVLVLGLLIWRAVRGSQMRAALEQFVQESRHLESRLARVEQELAELQARVVPPMAGMEEPPPIPVAPTLAVLVTLPMPMPVPVEPPVITPTVRVLEPVEDRRPTNRLPRAFELSSPIPPPVPSEPLFDWEQFVGVKLFAWLGGLALFFAAVLGLKYSFDHDLVPPAVRAAGGFLLGAGLVVGGILLRRKAYLVTSQTLCATGIVILYSVTFACRAYYHFPFFGQTTTFLLMSILTATAFYLAVRLEAQVVAVLGMLGGFLTPVMLSTGENNPLGLFGYVALLDVGLLAVTWRKRWDYLALSAASGTVVMQVGWFAKFFASEEIFVAQAVFLGFPLLFFGAFVWAHRRDWLNPHVIAAVALPAVVALVLSFNIALGGTLGGLPGRSFSIAFGADLILLAMVALRPSLRWLESVGGGALFVLLACWTLGSLTAGLLYWAFGLYLAFAVLHTVFPLVLERLRPREMPSGGLWSQFIPAAALLLVLLPIVRELTVPWIFWAVVLMVDLLAVLLALVAGALLGLLAVLVFTVAITAVWLAHSTTQAVDLSESIVVIGGFALFFFAASAFVWKKTLPSAVAVGLGLEEQGDEPDASRPADLRSMIPALSAVLPFLLLIMVVAQFKPANPSPVYGLAAVLVILQLGLARITRLDSLLAGALGSVWLLQAAWLGSAFDPQRAGVPLAWNLGFYAVLSVFPFVFVREYRLRTLPWAVSALTGLLQFVLVYWLVLAAYPHIAMGLLPAAFAVFSLGGLWAVWKLVPVDAPSRSAQLAWWGGVALFFLTIILPIQFSRQWITVGWALEGAALCWLFRRVPHPGLRQIGVALLVAAFVRLALNPAVLSYHPRAATPILNWYLYTYTTVAMSLFAAARLLAPPRHELNGYNVPPLLQGGGTVLAFLLMNLEIADYFGSGATLTFEFSGNFARDMTYTIAWSLFAFVLLLVGIGRRVRAVRYASIGLLGVALLKLFFHDLARLNQLYRIGAFVAVAIIAMLASFLYQRFLAADEVAAETVHPQEGN